LAGWAEYALPFLLLIGLASRLAAAGILFMTLLIQFYVFWSADDFWLMMLQTHIFWAVPMLVIMKYGAGSLSVDALLKKTVFAR
jgi:putative oxidoreductase